MRRRDQRPAALTTRLDQGLAIAARGGDGVEQELRGLAREGQRSSPR
jgi:hypothetical protein